MCMTLNFTFWSSHQDASSIPGPGTVILAPGTSYAAGWPKKEKNKICFLSDVSIHGLEKK